MLERAAIAPRCSNRFHSLACLQMVDAGVAARNTDHGTRQATAHLLNVGVDSVGGTRKGKCAVMRRCVVGARLV
jgi:hypothetical protein